MLCAEHAGSREQVRPVGGSSGGTRMHAGTAGTSVVVYSMFMSRKSDSGGADGGTTRMRPAQI